MYFQIPATKCDFRLKKSYLSLQKNVYLKYFGKNVASEKINK